MSSNSQFVANCKTVEFFCNVECCQLLCSTQVHSGPLRSTQVHSGPLRPTQVHSGPLRSTLVHSGPLWSTRVDSGRLRPTQVHSGSLRSTQVYLGPHRSTTQVHSGPLCSTQVSPETSDLQLLIRLSQQSSVLFKWDRISNSTFNCLKRTQLSTVLCVKTY
jgi:hypothetical protein